MTTTPRSGPGGGGARHAPCGWKISRCQPHPRERGRVRPASGEQRGGRMHCFRGNRDPLVSGRLPVPPPAPMPPAAPQRAPPCCLAKWIFRRIEDLRGCHLHDDGVVVRPDALRARARPRGRGAQPHRGARECRGRRGAPAAFRRVLPRHREPGGRAGPRPGQEGVWGPLGGWSGAVPSSSCFSSAPRPPAESGPPGAPAVLETPPTNSWRGSP